MEKPILIITSIADQNHPQLKATAHAANINHTPFILIGDTKSPKEFALEGCMYYSIEKQRDLPFQLAGMLPTGHYARKNLGYLIAMSQGATIIVETDDDNDPLPAFWASRTKHIKAHHLQHNGWVNGYRYFTNQFIWPRGFALEHLHDPFPELGPVTDVYCPIQQGLADGNPDVDALYRLLLTLPVTFDKGTSIALGESSVCPFNSQNTTWFEDAFPLLYLPSYCSFRMTDIWRSFVAQRIAWTCGWSVLFHESTVWQDRNMHNLMSDFKDEIIGYTHNAYIVSQLMAIELQPGISNIPSNMRRCYERLIDLQVIDFSELSLLEAWLDDVASLRNN